MIEDTNERYILSLVDRHKGIIIGAVTIPDPELLKRSFRCQLVVRRMLECPPAA